MASKPKISVVIATFNRCKTLRVTLEKLAAQRLPANQFEVIVIDDGSTDNTSQMVPSLVPSMPYQLEYYRHENMGPGYTQNCGIKKARSNLILLIADDIWPTSELLNEHLNSHFEYSAENFATLGKVIQSPDLPRSVMHKYWDPFRFNRFDGKKELASINFLACNISLKTNFLIQNGLYKERKGAAHEDIELGYRLGQKGLRIIYNEKALGFHHHEETLTAAFRRAYERGYNFDMLSRNITQPYI